MAEKVETEFEKKQSEKGPGRGAQSFEEKQREKERGLGAQTLVEKKKEKIATLPRKRSRSEMPPPDEEDIE